MLNEIQLNTLKIHTTYYFISVCNVIFLYSSHHQREKHKEKYVCIFNCIREN